jgi:MOSC domain-containing protein YiiM
MTPSGRFLYPNQSLFDISPGFSKAAKLMVESGYCGAYLAVLTPGAVEAGQDFTIEPGPGDLALLDLFRSHTAGKKF